MLLITCAHKLNHMLRITCPLDLSLNTRTPTQVCVCVCENVPILASLTAVGFIIGNAIEWVAVGSSIAHLALVNAYTGPKTLVRALVLM